MKISDDLFNKNINQQFNALETFSRFDMAVYYCIPSSSNDKFNISKQRTKVAFEVLNVYFEIFLFELSKKVMEMVP